MKVSFLKLFRLIFVIYFLFLLKEIFHRWDGVRYYVSFFEFMPDISLLSILLSTLALLVTIVIWLPLILFERVSYYFEKDKRRYLILFAKVFILNAVSIWAAKKLIWPNKVSLQVKTAVLLGVVLLSICLTWLLLRKIGDWVDRVQDKTIPDIGRFIQERIGVLVWPFGIFVILSIPYVAYHTWFKQANNSVLTEIGHSSASDTDRPNFILITFDALTARHMSVYGYHKETTPFIGEWAKHAAVFTLAEASGNFTTPTTASLMTGKRIWTHQIYHLGGTGHIKNKTENMPFVLKKNGYYNAAFVVNRYASVRTLGITEGFDFAPFAVDLMEPGNILFGDPNTAPGLIDAFLYRMFGEKFGQFDWVTDDRLLLWNKFRQPLTITTAPPEKSFKYFLSRYNDFPKPFFVWIHLLPPHEPYLPPAPYKGMFSERREINGNNPNRNSYDEFIRYCDNQFADFIKSLQLKHLKNTIIILSSDHGESFDHGIIGHRGPHLYEQLTHIPLIIKESEQSGGIINNELVEQIDIPATILDLAKIPIPSWMEGRSLVSLMRGGEIPKKPSFSMQFEENRSRGNKLTKGTIAVHEGKHKLIHYLGEQKSLLFNLSEDPGESNNLIDKETEIGKYLLELVHINLNEANDRILKEWQPQKP